MVVAPDVDVIGRRAVMATTGVDLDRQQRGEADERLQLHVCEWVNHCVRRAKTPRRPRKVWAAVGAKQRVTRYGSRGAPGSVDVARNAAVSHIEM